MFGLAQKWFGGQREPWRRLLDGTSVEVMNEDTGELVDLAPVQQDATDIEGLLIGFTYVDFEDRWTRRVVLCWQCWCDEERLYVRGYCPKRNALRTFRIDRMRDLEEIRSGRKIADVQRYFSVYAGQPPQELAPANGYSVHVLAKTEQEVEAETFRRHQQHRARQACIAGLRVLAYLALADDARSEEERNIELSYVESRLAACGFDYDRGITEAMADIARALAVPQRSFTVAAGIIAKEEAYFRLVWDCAQMMVTIDGDLHPIESDALHRLRVAGTRAGWLPAE